MRPLCLLYKFLSTQQVSHIHSLLSQMKNSYKLSNTFNVFPCQTEYFKFFILHISLMNGITFVAVEVIFCNVLLKFIGHVEWKIFRLIFRKD